MTAQKRWYNARRIGRPNKEKIRGREPDRSEATPARMPNVFRIRQLARLAMAFRYS